MSSFDELLAARKAAGPKTVTVPVLLDVDASDRIEEIEAELRSIQAKNDGRLSKSDGSKELQAELEQVKADSLDAVVDLVFERVPGPMWTDITIRQPARLEAAVDVNYGYNIDAAVIAAAKAKKGDHSYAWRLENGSAVALTDEQWDDLFDVMSGNDFNTVRDAVFVLNEMEPAQRLVEAKKALAGKLTGSN